MKAIVAYSKPQGQYGKHYVATVVVDYDESHEKVKINVNRRRKTYSCESCGHFGTVKVIRPSDTSVQGSFHFYRYDTVKNEDVMHIKLKDPDVIYHQETTINFYHLVVNYHSHVYTPFALGISKNLAYPILVVNWDEVLADIQRQGRPVTVEEELITSVMNNQKITIQELLLQPARQPQLQSGLHFIEGELKYFE